MTHFSLDPTPVSLNWVIEQLDHHPDLTKITSLKEAIVAKLARGHLTSEETSAFLKDHLEKAEQELESCYSWFTVVDTSKHRLAQGILAAVVNQLAIPFTDPRARSILANFQKAWVWNEFVNWLIQKRDPYVPFNLSILYRPAPPHDKAKEPIPVDYFIPNDAQPESYSTPEKPASVAKKSFSKPAVALLLVYLDKMGYFKGTSARYQIIEEEAPKYHYSGDALYNEYRTYQKEANRIQPKTARHIQQAIELLKVHDGHSWSAAIGYAQADLMHIAEKYSPKA